ncbi:uncharacterized protein I206_103122 [Kwoniella pini CBS 10737]|uniref:Uncharacterized protein n=1 Tax=Kwoniella pini CBS 10737 TaxID=1296096 RepID=A0A1B9IAX5_9TREE|nr:uncharacterized protein I206_01874 [Kwoniella pini CBS 10737]OCF52581.1 hypothetical protein I206_01874 [Kwoniella pini CBS 10737]
MTQQEQQMTNQSCPLEHSDSSEEPESSDCDDTDCSDDELNGFSWPRTYIDYILESDGSARGSTVQEESNDSAALPEEIDSTQTIDIAGARKSREDSSNTQELKRCIQEYVDTHLRSARDTFRSYIQEAMPDIFLPMEDDVRGVVSNPKHGKILKGKASECNNLTDSIPEVEREKFRAWKLWENAEWPGPKPPLNIGTAFYMTVLLEDFQCDTDSETIDTSEISIAQALDSLRDKVKSVRTAKNRPIRDLEEAFSLAERSWALEGAEKLFHGFGPLE